jgi:hypothetical protein
MNQLLPRSAFAKARVRNATDAMVLLASARSFLTRTEDLPTIADLVDAAEAVRTAGRALKLSVEGINAWTRFKVDAQRKGHARIAELREAGELAADGGDRKSVSAPRTLILKDLIGKRARQRASAWARLAILSETEIDVEQRKANDALKLLSETALLKLASAHLAEQRRANSRAAKPLPDGMQLRIGDCRKVLADIPDNSVAMVLTDYPYVGDESAVLCRWLAQFAARVLVPGGSLICYTGHWCLDRDMRIFGEHLRYWWILAMLHHQSRHLPGKFVIANWKPILWYVKDFRRGRTLVPDVLRPPQREKVEHDWCQGEGGVTQLIPHFAGPGDLIVDPFAGTATWGRIAAGMGRRWIGADVVEGGAATIVADEPPTTAAGSR